jgi:hypothetical protein
VLALRHDRREDAAAAGLRRLRVLRHLPHHFVVFVEPDEVIRVDRPAALDQQAANRRRPGDEDGIAAGVDEPVGIGAMVEQQADDRLVALPGGLVQRRAGSAPRASSSRTMWS